MQKTLWIAAALTTAMQGCASTQLEPIDVSAIGAVQAEIKRQIGKYVADEAVRLKDITPLLDTAKSPYWCGTGTINFRLYSIKMDLTTKFEDIPSISGSAIIPAGHIVTLGPSFSGKKDTTNTQELIYNEWLAPEDYSSLSPEQFGSKPTPIADALESLRTALVSTAKKQYDPIVKQWNGPQPCFTDYDPTKPVDDDPKDSFQLGITIVRDTTYGLTIKLANIVSLGASRETKSTTGNSITVSFRQIMPVAAPPKVEGHAGRPARPVHVPSAPPPSTPTPPAHAAAPPAGLPLDDSCSGFSLMPCFHPEIPPAPPEAPANAPR